MWLGWVFALHCEIRIQCTNGEPEERILWRARVGRLIGASDMVGELTVCLSPMRYGRDAAADDSCQPFTSELGTRRETGVGLNTQLIPPRSLGLAWSGLFTYSVALDSQILHYFA
jgi:hypothetical protein